MTSLEAPNLAQEVQFALVAMTNLSMVKVVQWEHREPLDRR